MGNIKKKDNINKMFYWLGIYPQIYTFSSLPAVCRLLFSTKALSKNKNDNVILWEVDI